MNIYLVKDSAEQCGMENDIDYGGNDVIMPDGKLKCSSPYYSACTESSPVLDAPSCRSFCLESNYFTWKSSSQECYCKNSNLGKAQQSGSTSGSTICPGKARIPIVYFTPHFCMDSKKKPTYNYYQLIFTLQVIVSQCQVQYPARSVPSHSNSKGFSTVNAPQWITKMINSGVQLKQIKMITILMVSGETVDCAIQVRDICKTVKV